jgi:hypothetical protein
MCDGCREKQKIKKGKSDAKRKREREVTLVNFKTDSGRVDDSPTARMMKSLDEDEGDVGDEEWDRMKKRIKLELADAKGKGKVPVKNPDSKVYFIMRPSLFIVYANNRKILLGTLRYYQRII